MAKNVPTVIPNCNKIPASTPAYFLYCFGATSYDKINDESINTN
jgi:hypothetical protein